MERRNRYSALALSLLPVLSATNCQVHVWFINPEHPPEPEPEILVDSYSPATTRPYEEVRGDSISQTHRGYEQY